MAVASVLCILSVNKKTTDELHSRMATAAAPASIVQLIVLWLRALSLHNSVVVVLPPCDRQYKALRTGLGIIIKAHNKFYSLCYRVIRALQVPLSQGTHKVVKIFKVSS